MKALMLGACLAAIAGAPVLAQPYDRDQGGGYQDQPDPYYDQSQPPPQPAQPPDGYQNDRGYDQQDGGYGQDNRDYDQQDRGYGQDNRDYDQQDRGYGQDNRDYQANPGWRSYGGAPPGARYTGRVGASWRNDQGQSCSWREMTWQDQEGNPAYKWVPRCRD
jgi:hypothetical protein